MAKQRALPNLFSSWPGTEAVREIIRPLAEALRDGKPKDLAQQVAECPALPEQFGCHLPSLDTQEQQALLHRLAYEDQQGRGRFRFLADGFLVRVTPFRTLIDRLPELHFPEDGDPTLRVNLLRAWFLHAVGGLPAVQQDLFDWLRSQEVNGSGLGEWAERFRINLPWVLDALEYIARSWRMSHAAWFEDTSLPAPVRLPWPIFPDGGSNPLAGEEGYGEQCRFTLSCSWFPSIESRPFAERRMTAELLTVAGHHLDRIDRLHQQHGYVRTRDTWTPGARRYLEERCEQLARHHCGGMSFKQLADDYPATKGHRPKYGEIAFDRERDRVKTIRRNVQQLADRIGLSLRPE